MSVQYHYEKFPPVLELDDQLTTLVHHARTYLGRYDGFLVAMDNREILLSPLFTQEAVLSSKIEGTQSTLREVLKFEAAHNSQKISEEKRADIQEILNYRHALFKAEKLLKKLPLSQRVLKSAHKELMQGVRGKDKLPGEYRKIPVWIGTNATSMEAAQFVPIEADKIAPAMTNFEKYIHNTDEYDDLIKIAILHAEFEAIHPFLDGNGRVGRMLIPLYLWQKKLLVSPSLYVSAYFEKNREQYYNLLRNVSAHDAWIEWCKFFIQGVQEQAEENFKRAKKINDFYQKMKSMLPKISRSPYGIIALDYIFKHTYFNSIDFYTNSNIPRTSAHRILNNFEEKNILICLRGKGRSFNFYAFKRLIDIANGK